MKFRLLNDYERFCFKIIDSIKFIKKHGHMATDIYFDYEGKTIKLNSKTEETYSYEQLKDVLVITQDMLYPIVDGMSLDTWMKIVYNIHKRIHDKDIVIKYDLLSYEERMTIQKVFEDYCKKEEKI